MLSGLAYGAQRGEGLVSIMFGLSDRLACSNMHILKTLSDLHSGRPSVPLRAGSLHQEGTADTFSNTLQ